MSLTLNIIVTVPVAVPKSNREEVTHAIRELLFGQDGSQGFDRIRDELWPILKAQNISTDKLQELSRPRLVVGCAPNAREVRLSQRLATTDVLTYLADRMKGQDIFAHVHLVKGERSYLADLASNLL